MENLQETNTPQSDLAALESERECSLRGFQSYMESKWERESIDRFVLHVMNCPACLKAFCGKARRLANGEGGLS